MSLGVLNRLFVLLLSHLNRTNINLQMVALVYMYFLFVQLYNKQVL